MSPVPIVVISAFVSISPFVAVSPVFVTTSPSAIPVKADRTDEASQLHAHDYRDSHYGKHNRDLPDV